MRSILNESGRLVFIAGVTVYHPEYPGSVDHAPIIEGFRYTMEQLAYLCAEYGMDTIPGLIRVV